MKRALVLLAIVLPCLWSSHASAQEKGYKWYVEPGIVLSIPVVEDNRHQDVSVGIGLAGGIWVAQFGTETHLALELLLRRNGEQGPSFSTKRVMLPTGLTDVNVTTFWRRYQLTIGPRLAFPLSPNLDLFLRVTGGVEGLSADETTQPLGHDDDSFTFAPMATAGAGVTRKLLGALSGGLHLDVPVMFRSSDVAVYIDAGATLSLTF